MSQERLEAKIAQHAPRYAPPGTPLSIRLVGPGRLRGWTFVVDLHSARGNCRVGNVVEGGEDEEVWGALYELDRELVVRSDGNRSVLDRIEGHRTERDPPNYEPATVTVQVADLAYVGQTYIGRPDARERCMAEHPHAVPSEEYGRAVLEGARVLGLPQRYRASLGSLLGA